jgi:hypothetical protein
MVCSSGMVDFTDSSDSDISGNSTAGWLVTRRSAVGGGLSDIPHWVTVDVEHGLKATCSNCHFSTKYLLPCRHIMAVNLQALQREAFQESQCHKRWHLASDQIPRPPPTTAVPDRTVDIDSHEQLDSVLDGDSDDGRPECGKSDDVQYLDTKAEFDWLCSMVKPLGAVAWHQLRTWLHAYGVRAAGDKGTASAAPAQRKRRAADMTGNIQVHIPVPNTVIQPVRKTSSHILVHSVLHRAEYLMFAMFVYVYDDCLRAPLTYRLPANRMCQMQYQ